MEPPIPQPAFNAYAGDINEGENQAIISSDSSLIFCGTVGVYSHIFKMTRAGSKVWEKSFLAPNGKIASISESNSQDLFLCGSIFKGGYYQFLLIKANSNGDTLWSKYYGTPSVAASGLQIIKTTDGNLVMCGTSGSDIRMIKVNTNGDTLWTKTYAKVGTEFPVHLLETQNGELLVTCDYNNSMVNSSEVYLLKVNSANGGKVWDSNIGPVANRWVYSSCELATGEIVMCGKYKGGIYYDVMVIKTTSTGTKIWEKYFGRAEQHEMGYSIKRNQDGSVTITGYSQNEKDANTEVALLKLDASGNEVFFKRLGGTKSDIGYSILKDYNDDNIILGKTESYGPSSLTTNVFMFRTNKDGNY